MGTDRDWENWGRRDPYFGVLSDASFHTSEMSDEARRTFFESGEQHVEHVLALIHGAFAPGFRPSRSLDFGCGVGRLLLPLARRSTQATGVDVSPAMLAEATRNCTEAQLANVDFRRSDDALSQVDARYDLVHSHLVFAHIAPQRGHALIEALAERVEERGFLAVQVLYACNAPRATRALVKLRYRFALLNGLRNLWRGRPWSEPAMQLHVYDLGRLLQMLRRKGFGPALLETDAFGGGQFDSVVLVAQRRTAGDVR
jgi:SAM-dependent methyltransferase